MDGAKTTQTLPGSLDAADESFSRHIFAASDHSTARVPFSPRAK
jgi:hypothetical protein